MRKKVVIGLIGLIGCALVGGFVAWAIQDYSSTIRQRYPVEWRVAPNAKVTFNGSARADSFVYVSDSGDLLIFDNAALPFLYFPEKKRHAIMVADDFYKSGKTVRSVAVPRIGMWAGAIKGPPPLIINADGFEFEGLNGVIVRVVIKNAD